MMARCAAHSMAAAAAAIALALCACAGVVVVAAQTTDSEASLPCAARAEGQSVVCVCNSTYCDTIVRSAPAEGHYVAYTSSQDGLRFAKSEGEIERSSDSILDQIMDVRNGVVVLEVNTSSTYQTVEGFGGSVTDAAGINWRNLSGLLQVHLIRSYFSAVGLEYNMIRVPIGGSDFSTHPYTYNELPIDDPLLSNYSLTEEDFLYKIPMIKAAQAVSTSPLQVTASVWSPPVWMKTNGLITGLSRLKAEYYQTHADYHLKFLEKYAAEGIPVWAITTGNEPINGVIPLVRFNSLGWTPATQAQWVAANLGPTIRNSQFADTKILAADDQRYTLPIWMRGMVSANETAMDYIDGMAVHYYGNFVPARILSRVHDDHPNKIILSTEACEGAMPWNLQKVVLGSWRRARNYITDILDDLNNWVVGWIDWNLCLDAGGGPNWADNFVDAPIIVFPERDEFVKQPMFYAMGHFSKFVPRGSQRVEVQERGWRTVDHVAFRTPHGSVVLVLHNRGESKPVKVVVDGARRMTLQLPAESITSLELQP